MGIRVGLGLTVLTLAGLLLAAPARSDDSDELPNVEKAMVKVGRKLVRELQKRGYANVGVLKFLVSTDGKKASDSVGTLNMLLAKQLELTLLLKNDPKNPLGIIKNASAVALRTRGANHRSRDGREKLFAARYQLNWGNADVTADAFVTGVAVIHKDLTRLTVVLMVVDAKENSFTRLGEEFVLKAKMDSSKLAEAGESFVLRGAFDDGADTEVRQKKAEAAVVKAALKAREQKQQNPYFVPNNAKPVTLTVLYDDKPVEIVFRDGKARIPTPKLGQNVKFRLTRDSGKDTYGVVLKVNGESTYHRQKGPDLECTRWIMKPGSRGFTLDGFSLPDNKKALFRVASRAESAQQGMNYGDDAGTISLTVFRQRKGEAPVADTSDRDYTREAIVKKAKLPEETAENYGALVARIEEESTRGIDGGLILSGPQVKGKKLDSVKFEPDPTPIMSLTIVYYTP